MTVETLTGERVLISLFKEDMESFELDPKKIDIKNPKTKRALFELLFIACLNCGITLDSKRFLIEALPAKDGCLFIISASPVKKRKVYRIKKNEEYPCFIFENAGDMLDALSSLCASSPYYYSNSLFEKNGKYYLVFDYPVIPQKARVLLSEFAKEAKIGKIFLSHLHEHGGVIALGNAIAKIGT